MRMGEQAQQVSTIEHSEWFGSREFLDDIL